MENRSRDFGGSRGNGGFRPRPMGPREEFDATCSACGKQTKVPFKPTPGRDVFCRECFASRKKVE